MAPVEVLANQKPWTINWPPAHILSITWHTAVQTAKDNCGELEGKDTPFHSNPRLEMDHIDIASNSEDNEIVELSQHQCLDCKKIFKHRHKLKKHSQVHSPNRPYSCAECSQTFKRKYHLTRHERVHTGERPFACDECGNKYRRKSQLDRHYLIHTGERPHECGTCYKTFRRKSHLTRHIKTHASKA